MSDKYLVRKLTTYRIDLSFFVSLLSVPLSFNVSSFNGRSTCHLNVDQFIDGITEQLQQVILVYEMTSLSKRKLYSLFVFFL